MEVDTEPALTDGDAANFAEKDATAATDQVSEKAPAEPEARGLSRLARTISRTSTRNDPGPPPDGGAKAWTQVVCAHFVVASCWGFITSFGAFQTYYTTDLGLDPSDVSWIGSLQTTLLFLVGVGSGRAMDAGYFKMLLTSGALLQVIGVMGLSVSRQYYALILTQGLVFGLGCGLVFTPTMALLATYFAKKRSLVMGFSAIGSCTGGLIFPAIVRELLSKIGFGWTVRILGFIMLAFNIPGIALMRTRIPPRTSGPLVEWTAFTEAPYVLFVSGMFFVFWSLYFAFYYVGSFGRNIVHLDYANSINLLMVMVGIGLPGRLIPNYIADRYFGPLQSMTPFAFLCSVMFFCWISVSSSTSLYVFAAFYGTGSAAIQSLFPATLSSLTEDLKKAGTRLGMGFTIVSMATLTGPPLAGALVARHGGNYLYAQLWAGCSMLLGGSLLIAARVAKVGLEVRRRV